MLDNCAFARHKRANWPRWLLTTCWLTNRLKLVFPIWRFVLTPLPKSTSLCVGSMKKLIDDSPMPMFMLFVLFILRRWGEGECCFDAARIMRAIRMTLLHADSQLLHRLARSILHRLWFAGNWNHYLAFSLRLHKSLKEGDLWVVNSCMLYICINRS